MAKSKKSKILAMALCASVMTGIYASPVMAAKYTLDNNSSVTTENTTSTGGYTQNEVRVNIDDGVNGSQTIGTFYSNEMEAGFKTDYTMTASTFTLEAGGNTWASLTVNGLTYTNQNTLNNVSLTADGLTFSNLRNSEATAVLNAAAINSWNEKTQNINAERTEAGKTYFDGKVIADKFGTDNSSFYVEENGTIKGNSLIIGKNGDNAVFKVDRNGAVKAANGAFTVDKLGNTVSKGDVTSTAADGRTYTLNTVGNNTQKITFDGEDTVVAGKLVANKFGTPNSSFYVEENGTIKGNSLIIGKNGDNAVFKVDRNGAVKAANGAFYVDKDGNVKNVGTVDGVDVSALSENVGGISGNVDDLEYKTQNIDKNRTGKGYTTFNGALNTDGTIRAAGGAVELRGNLETDGTLNLRYTNGQYESLTATQLGNINDMITGEGVLENVVSINGASVEGTEFGGLKISDVTLEKGGIWADKLNGRDIADYVTGDEIEEDLANVGGITRSEGATDPGTGTTTIENFLNVSGNSVSASLGDNSFTFDNSGFKFTGDVNLGSASDIYFNYGGVGNGTDYAGSYTLEDLADTVADIYDRTQAIDYENGKTTIKGDLDVVKDPNAGSGEGDDPGTGEGGNTGNGNGHYDGNLDVDGGITAGDSTIGGVGLEGGTVTADKVVTGNTTLDNEGLNVGGQTSVTADGVNVGGNGGTTVSKDGVSIADKTIISDHDVVINEGTADRVSLSETADRVGNLEQGVSELNNRVGELEDRIDKVGAIAAAIANLRTMGYDPAAPTEVAVGIGQYRDETGAALGLFHYPNRDFMLSLSVSTSGDEVMGGIGATWKFGRKSPEKVAEIKKAQAEAAK